jgi:hypothetical protein
MKMGMRKDGKMTEQMNPFDACLRAKFEDGTFDAEKMSVTRVDKNKLERLAEEAKKLPEAVRFDYVHSVHPRDRGARRNNCLGEAGPKQASWGKRSWPGVKGRSASFIGAKIISKTHHAIP